jgi:malate synthase
MAAAINEFVTDIEIKGSTSPETNEILTTDSIQFISKLNQLFNQRRLELLKIREKRQLEINSGIMPKFLEETKAIRNGNWTAAPIPDDLLDRRVEITGPVDRRTIINALNSGANVFMADFEDSNSLAWSNVIEGQVNLKDAIDGTITYLDSEKERLYKLNDETAALIVRPRGWHLDERHFLIEGKPVSASLFDFGIYLFHNAQKLIDKGSAPYFSLPKLENHLEARLWNDVFVFAQKELGITVGTIKATVTIDSILAAFEMDEILFELKEHSAGLSTGRCNYIFSFIKKFRNHPMFILPDQEQVTMDSHCMQSYSRLLIKTCHKRNVHAISGSAQIPVKGNPETYVESMKQFFTYIESEAIEGYDGTRVSNIGFVTVIKKIFDKNMFQPNQINLKRDDVNILAEDLLTLPVGTITLDGLKTNIDNGIQYLVTWLKGGGYPPLNNFMDDTAIAEISRTQVWQWFNNQNCAFEDGSRINNELYSSVLEEQTEKIRDKVGEEKFNKGAYRLAAEIFDSFVREKDFTEFLTIKMYGYI